MYKKKTTFILISILLPFGLLLNPAKVIADKDDILLVNKTYSLSKDYVPESLVYPNVKYVDEKEQLQAEAAQNLEQLFEDALNDGIELYATSGYRSFEYQENLYDYYVSKYGEDYANRVSAKPGESEHQTGLAMDVTSRSVDFDLDESFGDTVEGKWVARNAHNYGYIIRYPEGKESITGYKYEPWHLRYIGKDHAYQIASHSLTLEEYLLNDETDQRFSDVSNRYQDAVNYLVKENLTNGLTETRFGVFEPIKRGDAAIILAKALGLQNERAPESGFIDVPERGVLEINALKEQRIIDGKTKTDFGFYDNITRGEMALVLANAFGFKGEALDLSFTDVNSRYATAVAGLVDEGVTKGVSANSFGTNQAIKRGNYALFIYRSTAEDHQQTYTIKRGDTLSEIAATFTNVTVDDILEANPSLQPNQLTVGTTIVIPS